MPLTLVTLPREDHELPVKGSHVHDYILPGFRYRVRLAGTDEYFFHGKPTQLESIGRGYGKKFTFEAGDILENDNYFWSDSNERGYVFSIQVLFPGEAFEIHNNHGVCVGYLTIVKVDEKQKVNSVTCYDSLGSVHVEVKFSGSIKLFPETSVSELYKNEIEFQGNGIAIVNHISSTLKLTESNINPDLFERFNIEHFIKFL